MPVTSPRKLNFLYVFEAGSQTHRLTDVAVDQTHAGDTYTALQVAHTPPRYSAEPQDAEIDVTMLDASAVGELFLVGPPPYPVIIRIYEYDRVANTVTPYYRGWVVRASFTLTASKVELHCKTVWHFFERESFTDSLSALSRYSIFDPRADIDLSALRINVTAASLNNERDVLTVTGITEIDGWFTGGVIVAPDQDKRTILKHETVGADKLLTLAAAFPQFTLDTGFPAELYPGDDLTYDTWANKFAAVTNNGEKWGGWQYMPNVDPAVRGVI